MWPRRLRSESPIEPPGPRSKRADWRRVARCSFRPARAGPVRPVSTSAARWARRSTLSAEPLAYNDPRIGELEANVVFDPVGAETYESSLNALKSGGKLVTPGALGGPVAPVNLWTLVSKGATIIGVGAAAVSRKRFEQLIDLAGRGKLQPAVDRELPLEQAADAPRLVEQRQVFGKIVLRTD
jgi:D-arabinose 1-dehydrogenase-like Zn-dependent alcohol dehydrogenase